ncbi:C40 family peptidase [Paenibacillus sp. PK4536]|uniref:Putative endopeptidase p60 n=1 Tax=Paenibacillus nuruki TaxID=1886670 RepID=A0A1E3L007_9BACL|nr:MULTISPECIES: C40 family peptidase [Paenibacillus]ODP27056.1 putative endopeptidase p60 [Paenibacillus nuruki]TKJ84764.1 NlpC/P60 family protein [Paenibacillus sp. CFBP13512]WIM41462.1 C40 family peptidase [Paenibacillus sp. PK4536]CAJ1317204.1 NlpC/P60 family protein [Paenibacillus nuruki]
MKKKLTAAVMGLAIAFTSLGVTSAHADSKMDQVIDGAIGTPYRIGGTSFSGFDCSGFTQYVFGKMNIDLPRQSSSQYQVGEPVSKSDLIAGDLLFFNTTGAGVSHVAVYVGNGNFAHASTSKGVRIDSLSMDYYQNRYVGAKRVMSDSTYNTFATDN